MIKYIKHHLSDIDNVQLYPLISLILFLTVFVLMTFYVFKIPKKNIKEISQIPLEEKQNTSNYE